MSYVLYVAASLVLVNVLLVILSVGKPRGPITPASAATIALLDGFFAAALIVAAGRLS